MKLIRKNEQKIAFYTLWNLWLTANHFIDDSEKEGRKEIEDLLVRLAYIVGGIGGEMRLNEYIRKGSPAQRYMRSFCEENDNANTNI